MIKFRLVIVLFVAFLLLIPSNIFATEIRIETPIYIRADGSIEPSSAPIQREGEIYTLTEDFFAENDGIIIQRNNITLDGNGHKLSGNNQEEQQGILLTGVQHVTVKNFEIEFFNSAIHLVDSSQNIIEHNNLFNNYRGINFDGVNTNNLINNNLISGNQIAVGPWNNGDLINSTISQNQIEYNGVGLNYGMEYHAWINNTITNNIISNNLGSAISFVSYKAYADGNIISNNEIKNNGGTAIELLLGCMDNKIIDNVIAENGGLGLYLQGSNSEISGNLIEDNLGGIRIIGAYVGPIFSSNNIIDRNQIIANTEYGIYFSGAAENVISNNKITENTNGLILERRAAYDYFFPSNNNLITGNQIINCSNYAVQIKQSNENRLYNNSFIENLAQVYSEDSINIWDNEESAGNFWSDYSGVDENGDGIGDLPYFIDELNQDNFPIVPIEIEPIIKFDLTLDAVGSGFTSLEFGTYSYEDGSNVSVTATPSLGWTFSNWMLDSLNMGSDNPIMISMNTNHSLTAVFHEIPPPPTMYALTIGAIGSGSISPNIGTYSCEYGNEIVIVASAPAGWRFDYWLLDSIDVGSTNPFTLTMDMGHVITAVFEEDLEVNDDVSSNVTSVLGESVQENNNEKSIVTQFIVNVETKTYIIETSSNSTVSNLVYNSSLNMMSFNVEGPSETIGVCNISIPSELFSGQFSIYKDEALLTEGIDFTQTKNITHYLLTIRFNHSSHIIQIHDITQQPIETTDVNDIPEFPSWVVLPLFFIGTLAVIELRKKLKKN